MGKDVWKSNRLLGWFLTMLWAMNSLLIGGSQHKIQYLVKKFSIKKYKYKWNQITKNLLLGTMRNLRVEIL